MLREGSSSNRYEILTKLVEGGMASIFLARNATGAGVERIVVLKRIIAALAHNRELVEMFVHEARLAAQLQHPNVAQVYDVGKLGNSYFFAMEYVHGRTVRELTLRSREKRSPIPIANVLSIAAGIAAGLHHAHERRGIDGLPLGIVHSDVSPTNVLISTEGVVKLVDFGIARAATGPQPNGKLLGKTSYLSPEQCHSLGSVDRRTDLFSLGIVMWELLTLYSLYRRANDYETIKAIEQEAPSPPSRVRPDVPTSVDAIVLKLLAKNPADRYQTAAELLEAIEHVAHEQRLMLSVPHLAKLMESLFGHSAEPWLAQSETGASRLIIASEPVPQRWSKTAAGEIDEKLRVLSPVTPAPGDLPSKDTIPERRQSVELSAELLADQADHTIPDGRVSTEKLRDYLIGETPQQRANAAAAGRPNAASPTAPRPNSASATAARPNAGATAARPTAASAPAAPNPASAPAPRPNAAGQLPTPAPLPQPPPVGPSRPQPIASGASRPQPIQPPAGGPSRSQPITQQGLQAVAPRAQTAQPAGRAPTAQPVSPAQTAASVGQSPPSSAQPQGPSNMQPKGPPGPFKPAQAGTLQSSTSTPAQGSPQVPQPGAPHPQQPGAPHSPAQSQPFVAQSRMQTPPQGAPQQPGMQPQPGVGGSQTVPPGQQFVAQSRMQTAPPGQFVAQSRMQTAPPGQFVAESRMNTPAQGAPVPGQSMNAMPAAGQSMNGMPASGQSMNGMPQMADPARSQAGMLVAQSRMNTPAQGAPINAPAVMVQGVPGVEQSRTQTPPAGAPMVAQSRMSTVPPGQPFVAQSRMPTPPAGTPALVEGIRDPKAPRKADPMATMLVDRSSEPSIVKADAILRAHRAADSNRTLLVEPLETDRYPRAKKSKLPLIIGGIVTCVAGIVIAIIVMGNRDASKQAPTTTAKLAPASATKSAPPSPPVAPAAPINAPTAPIAPAASPVDAAVAIDAAQAVETPPAQGSAATTTAATSHHHDKTTAETSGTATATTPELENPFASSTTKPTDAKPPTKASKIEKLFEAGSFGDVVLACVSGAKSSDYPTCVVAACQIHDGMHANKWLAKSAKSERESIVQKCRYIGMNLEMPKSKQSDCASDPDACIE